eukprot:12533044-Alexandrium_andersonii.AAC.1
MPGCPSPEPSSRRWTFTWTPTREGSVSPSAGCGIRRWERMAVPGTAPFPSARNPVMPRPDPSVSDATTWSTCCSRSWILA